MEILCQPGHPLRLRRQICEDREAEAGPLEGPPEGLEVRTELRLKVLDHSIVCGGGGGECRHAVGKKAQDIDDPSVIGTEIMPPVTNAMRFVDYE